MRKRKLRTPTLRSLSSRMRKLNQKFLEYKHYWEVRCEERKALSKTIKRSEKMLARLEKLEALAAHAMGRTRFLRLNPSQTAKNKFYYLALTRNEILVLRKKIMWLRLMPRPRKSKFSVHLTYTERAKLIRFLRNVNLNNYVRRHK